MPASDPPAGDVRVATVADRPAVLTTIVAAFRTDPGWGYLLGEHYDRLAPLFAGALFDQRVGAGTVWMAADAASVALWDAPGQPDPAVHDAAWEAFERTADSGSAARLADYDAALAAVRPADPVWYLGVLATAPERAGSGGATRVLAPGLARADADGLDACLETSTLANRAFYGRRGFTGAVQVPLSAGPATWWLTRSARP